MEGLITLLFNPITLFGLLFIIFGIKNLVTRHYPSAIIYLILSVGIITGGAWIWAKAATSQRGPKVVTEHESQTRMEN